MIKAIKCSESEKHARNKEITYIEFHNRVFYTGYLTIIKDQLNLVDKWSVWGIWNDFERQVLSHVMNHF